MKDLRYPIGNFELRPFDEVTKNEWLNDFRNLPKDLENVVKILNQNQLDTPYREGGWTVQQVVHHLADSHMNCYIYFKLTLTEELPIIKDYNENDWSNTTDVLHTPINFSINLLYALHQRWADLLSSFTTIEWQKKFFHPTHKIEISLWDMFTIYVWHGKHHIAHIENLIETKGW